MSPANLHACVDAELDRIRAAIAGARTRTEIVWVLREVRETLHKRVDEALTEAPIQVSSDTRWP